jgi:hypothetical protein
MARHYGHAWSITLFALTWVSTALCADIPEPGEAPGFSGYYKNLLIRSRTLSDETAKYVFDVNRLRLEKRGQITDDLSFDIQYDNEVLFGSYLGTAQFRAQKSIPTGQYWDLESAYHDSADAFARHRIYRGYLSWSSGATDVRLGRQRIAWGSGKFWSPLDVLNPADPTTLERDERTGLDSLLVERRLSAVARISAVYAPQRMHGDDALALQWHGNKAGIDFSLMASRFMRARVVGVELAGQVGGAGLRAELTRTLPGSAPAYTRVVLGVDYAFENTLALTGELYYNGAGARDRQSYDFAALFAGGIQSVARHYAGVHAAYDITPLLKLNVHLVANLDDGSRFIAPSATYSWKTNLDLTLGIQYAGGSSGGEFERFRNVFYMQLQRYF